MKRKLTIIISVIMFMSISAVYAQKKEPIRIGILDTGILASHKGFEGVNIESGENFVFPGSDTTDLLGHGSRIAGLIKDQCKDVTIVPLLVVSRYPTGLQKSCNGEEIAVAIIKAIDVYQCKIINISLGFREDNNKLRQAIAYAIEKEVIVVAAAGNNGEKEPEALYYPAAYEGVIAVGAADREGNPAAFSQKSYCSIYAPGVDVPVLDFGFSLNKPKATGTSYAAAAVTGDIADLLYEDPMLDPIKLREIIRSQEDMENKK